MSEAADFIRQHTKLAAPSIVPEIMLHMAAEFTPLWELLEDRLAGNGGMQPPPFWATAWPGGQGLARYMIDHAAEFRGRSVLDFAAGSGIAAIAAMKAGASLALATDIDPMALTAAPMNAARNGVVIGIRRDLDLTQPFAEADIIVAGDVCYQQAMSARVMEWLWMSRAAGARVLIADPGRAYVPKENMRELARYDVPTSRDLEDRESREVRVWEIGGQ